jgi:hypothetical protein
VVEKLDDLLGSHDSRPQYSEWGQNSYDKGTHSFRFSAHLRSEHRNKYFYKKICTTLNSSHLSGIVIVEIYDDVTKEGVMSIGCEDGSVEPSDWEPKPGDNPKMPGFNDDVSDESG